MRVWAPDRGGGRDRVCVWRRQIGAVAVTCCVTKCVCVAAPDRGGGRDCVCVWRRQIGAVAVTVPFVLAVEGWRALLPWTHPNW